MLMHIITMNKQFRVSIPQDLRDVPEFQPGKKLEVVYRNGFIELIPVKAITELKGKFKGLSYEGVREKQDRF